MTPSLPSFSNPLGIPAKLAWKGETFSAALFPHPKGWQLSICRNADPARVMSWEDLMQVKRDCGFGELDAVEVYPADKDIFNSGNLRHLFFIGELPFALRNTRRLQLCNPPELEE